MDGAPAKPQISRKVSFSDDILNTVNLEEKESVLHEGENSSSRGRLRNQASATSSSFAEYLVDVSDERLLVTRNSRRRSPSTSSSAHGRCQLSEGTAVCLEIFCLYTSILVTLAFFSIPFVLVFVYPVDLSDTKQYVIDASNGSDLTVLETSGSGEMLTPCAVYDLAQEFLDCSPFSWGVVNPDDSTGGCSAEPYTGSVCNQQLLAWQECVVGQLDISLVTPIDSNSSRLDSTVKALQSLLDQYASPACEEAALTLICQNSYRLCDCTTERLYLPSRDNCEFVQDTLCLTEWYFMQTQGFGNFLPDCRKLPYEVSAGGMSSGGFGSEPSQGVTTTPSVLCLDGFYVVNTTCQPRCDSWEHFNHAQSLALRTVEVFAATIGLTVSVAMIATIMIFYRELIPRLSFILAQSLGYIVITSLVLISNMTTGTLFCESEGLEEAYQNPSVFCTISGMLMHCFLLNTTLCWLFHHAIFFYRIACPFHSRMLVRSKVKSFMLYLVLFLIAYLLPVGLAVPPLVVDSLRYRIARFPPGPCLPKSSYWIYAGLLPINLALAAGCTLLIVNFWTVLKQQGFLQQMKRKQRKGLISRAEVKLLIASLTFIGFGISALLYGVLTGVTNEEALDAYSAYFACESAGHVPGKCGRETVEAHNYLSLAVLFYSFLGLVPVANFFVVLNLHAAKEKVLLWFFGQTKKARARRYSQQHSQTSQIRRIPSFLFKPSSQSEFGRRLAFTLEDRIQTTSKV